MNSLFATGDSAGEDRHDLCQDARHRRVTRIHGTDAGRQRDLGVIIFSDDMGDSDGNAT